MTRVPQTVMDMEAQLARTKHDYDTAKDQAMTLRRAHLELAITRGDIERVRQLAITFQLPVHDSYYNIYERDTMAAIGVCLKQLTHDVQSETYLTILRSLLLSLKAWDVYGEAITCDVMALVIANDAVPLCKLVIDNIWASPLMDYLKREGYRLWTTAAYCVLHFLLSSNNELAYPLLRAQLPHHPALAEYAITHMDILSVLLRCPHNPFLRDDLPYILKRVTDNTLMSVAHVTPSFVNVRALYPYTYYFRIYDLNNWKTTCWTTFIHSSFTQAMQEALWCIMLAARRLCIAFPLELWLYIFSYFQRQDFLDPIPALVYT